MNWTSGTLKEKEMKWHVVHTKPRQEKLASSRILQLGIESFLPFLKQAGRVGGKRMAILRPLFPGYLFVRFDASLSYRAVNYSQGVQNVVAFGDTLAVLDEKVIDHIRSKERDGYVTVQSTSFIPGQPVRIQNGHFQGLEAVFEREMEDRQRGMLLLQMLSYQARVIVDLQDVVNR